MSSVFVGCSTLLTVVLGWSAIGKLTRSGFAAAVTMFDELGLRRSKLVAGLLVAGEATVAIALWPAPTRLAGAAAALVLLVTLSIGVAVIVRRGLAVRCACFGAATSNLTTLQVARNVALAACAAVALVASLQVDGVRPGLDLLLPVGAGAVLALAVVRLEDLVFLVRPLSYRESP
jgi:Methylamine utilisation protein MauE